MDNAITGEITELLLRNEKIVLALRLAIQWKRFKIFCRNRKECKGCPYAIKAEQEGTIKYVCSSADNEVILFKIADAALEEFIKEGISI